MTGRFVAGDPIRGVAVLCIVVYHYAFAGLTRTEGEWLLGAYGEVGGRMVAALEMVVYVFFVLSAYLIAGPFVRAFVKGTAMPRVRAYTRNRVLRIVPAFWVVFTVLLLVHGGNGAGAGQIAAVYLFAQSYEESGASHLVGPAWTLYIELVFYALVPLVAYAAMRVLRPPATERARVRAVLLFAGVVWLVSVGLREVAPDDHLWQRSPPLLLFSFMPGVALACLDVAYGDRARRLRAPGLVAGGVALAVVALYALYGSRVWISGTAPLPGVWAAIIGSAASTAVIAAPLLLQRAGRPTPRLVDNRVLHWIGERSYGLYLVHQGVLVTLLAWFEIGGSPAQFTAVTLAIGVPLSLLCAAVLFRFVERPLMRRRHGWRRRGQPAEAPSMPTVPSG